MFRSNRLTSGQTADGGGSSRRRRSLGVATCGFAVALAASMVAVVTQTATVAGAATIPVAATWSATPNCTGYVTATPPAGTVSATVTINGGGGGAGATNSGSDGTGGSGAQITGTFPLTHTTGTVSVKTGCGGSGGSTGGGGGASIGGASGGAGYAAGASSGGASDESVSVDGIASGGGGGGATGLCLGNGTCGTLLAVAGGGGGGGARWDCTGSDGPGAGGSGQTGGTNATTSAGAAGTAGGDGSSNGGGGGGGTSAAGGSGGGGASHSGSGGGNTPTSSTGGAGGAGGGGFPYEAGASGGGGGGGYTGGGGGGGDRCTTGEDTGGGGGGGSSAVTTGYAGAVSYNGNGGTGASSGTGGAGSITLTWNVDNLSVTNPGTQSNVSGSAIGTLTIAAPHDTTGGNSVTFSATGLPAGLSINPSTGAITGTPTTASLYSATIMATDSQALSATANFLWNITNTVSVTNPGSKSSLSGSAITPVTNSATDSQSGAPLTWTASGLPTGLSINSLTGTISGTPTTAGTSSVTITATDGAAYHGSATFSWVITNNVAVTNPGSQTSVSGTAISPLAIAASDTSSAATLSYSATGLPAGLSINSSTGTVSGTPTTAGSPSVTVTATDGAGFHGSATFTWTVTNTVSATSPGNQSDVSGTAITTVSVGASDTSSTATLSYSDGGTLPPGLSIDPSSGAITGTPTTSGTYPVVVTVSDGAGYSAQASFSWLVSNVVTVGSPGDQNDISGSAIAPVNIVASDTSSTATLSYSAGSTLPGGLSIDPGSGVISGSPTVAGTYPVTVTVTDSGGYSAQTTFNWTITNSVSVTNPGSQSSVSGSPISELDVAASDSLPSATLSYSDGGTLPPGLSIDPASGAITGAPTTAGSYPVTVTVTDSADFAAQVSFTWTITNTVSVTNPGDQTSASGSAVAPLAIAASDSSGVATLTFATSTLPAGLSLDPSSGVITGTPTTAGSYAVGITVSDDAGFSGSTSFTWTVTNSVSVTNPGGQSSPSGSAVSPVSIAASDTSSTATLSYSAGSTLPPGLTINSTNGTISGTPTTGGSYPVTVTVTDDSGFAGTTSFTWTVTNTITVTNPGSELSGVGSAITPVHIVANDSSSTAALTFSDGGTLPPGLTIAAATGVVTGTPSTSGVFPVTVTATDNAGYSGSTTFTWTAVGPIITKINHNNGPGAGGTKIKISGSHLNGATSVKFGTVAATTFKVNKKGTKLSVTSPPGVAGTVDIVITTAAGPTLPTSVDQFTYLGPTVTSVSPASGLVAGGKKVTISGTGLTGATSVLFGSVPGTGVSANAKGTKLTVTAPAQSAGTVDIVVTTPGGTSAVTSADEYTYG